MRPNPQSTAAGSQPITDALYGKGGRGRTDKTAPEERLAEHIGARAPRRPLGGMSVGGRLRGELGTRGYGALLDGLGRKTRTTRPASRRPRPKSPVDRQSSEQSSPGQAG
jgi:hypothetical protein